MNIFVLNQKVNSEGKEVLQIKMWKPQTETQRKQRVSFGEFNGLYWLYGYDPLQVSVTSSFPNTLERTDLSKFLPEELERWCKQWDETETTTDTISAKQASLRNLLELASAPTS